MINCNMSGSLHNFYKTRAREVIDGDRSKKKNVLKLPIEITAPLYADYLVMWCTDEHMTVATHRFQRTARQAT